MNGMALRQAIAPIHADPAWLRKLLLYGLCSLTIIGAPIAAGWVMESIDNSRKGYPTPLPPWFDWTSRYLIGLFALLIDFTFFVLPLLIVGMLSVCVSIGLVGSGNTDPAVLRFWFIGVSTVAGLLITAAFMSSVSPLGRLKYAEEGRIEQALSGTILRKAWRTPGRNVFLAARLRSLVAYIPLVVLGAITVQVAQFSFSGQGLVIALLLWFTWAALHYAHLVVGQLYLAAEREAQRRSMPI
jgi:hypothetical protein